MDLREISHLLERVTVLEKPLQTEADTYASTYVSTKIQQYFRQYSTKLVTDVAYISTGQQIMKRYNKTLKELLIELKGDWDRYELS